MKTKKPKTEASVEVEEVDGEVLMETILDTVREYIITVEEQKSASHLMLLLQIRTLETIISQTVRRLPNDKELRKTIEREFHTFSVVAEQFSYGSPATQENAFRQALMRYAWWRPIEEKGENQTKAQKKRKRR